MTNVSKDDCIALILSILKKHPDEPFTERDFQELIELEKGASPSQGTLNRACLYLIDNKRARRQTLPGAKGQNVYFRRYDEQKHAERAKREKSILIPELEPVAEPRMLEPSKPDRENAADAIRVTDYEIESVLTSDMKARLVMRSQESGKPVSVEIVTIIGEALYNREPSPSTIVQILRQDLAGLHDLVRGHVVERLGGVEASVQKLVQEWGGEPASASESSVET